MSKSRKSYRRYTEDDEAVIRHYWPTRLPSVLLAESMGRTRGSLENFARLKLGLPHRNFLRPRMRRR